YGVRHTDQRIGLYAGKPLDDPSCELPRLTAGMVRPTPRKRRMVSMNWATGAGFDKEASQPLAGMRSPPPLTGNGVAGTSGMALSSGSPLSHLVTSRPETSGS